MNYSILGCLGLLSSVLTFIAPTPTSADIGVGVGVGKIEVTQRLNPGGIYSLPSIPVMNTGTETTEYRLDIEYHEKQAQLKPAAEWFSFGPSKFSLQPGQSKTAQISLTIPVNSMPGDYFAYVKAYPAEKGGDGSAKIGIAAAAKLYFTVAPANMLQGLYYRIATFTGHYWKWITGILVVLALIIVLVVFKKNFRLKIGIRFRKKRKKRTPKIIDEQ
ncbi:MAG: hypothetical protein MUD10_01825 [Candidatus Pacebacteria bacterium]|jgi:hypothetical protein|nr:hypothetical protein [Candidatus Paceibacterota bacterium]